MKPDQITMRFINNERKLLDKLKKETGWKAAQIIREALKLFAQHRGVA